MVSVYPLERRRTQGGSPLEGLGRGRGGCGVEGVGEFWGVEFLGKAATSVGRRSIRVHWYIVGVNLCELVGCVFVVCVGFVVFVLF